MNHLARPTALTVALFVVALGLTWTLWGSRSGTYYPDGSVTSERTIGPGPAVTITSDAEGESLAVSWRHVLALLLGAYATARATAYMAESSMRTPLLTVSRVSLFALATAFLLSIAFSRSYWGYFFARPSPEKVASRLTSVNGLSFIECAEAEGALACVPDQERQPTLESARAYCAEDPYYCLGDRLLVQLGELGILPPDPEPVESTLISVIPRLLRDKDLIAQPDPGYEPMEFSGLLVSGSGTGGGQVALVGLSGSEVSNDHYPYVELAIAQRPEPRILKAQQFYYDIAGIEGLEWFPVFIVSGSIGVLVVIPSAIGLSFFIERARRLRAV